ncbi:MAG: hypothetical protein U9Q03_06245 [Patescibacteria group bacterium]|nr:hypothetical protein [Patescibacteria group bacterium]
MTDQEETEKVPVELKAIIDKYAGDEGIQISDIEGLIPITVKTRYSEYVIIILEQGKRDVLLMGGVIEEKLGDGVEEKARVEGYLIGSSNPWGNALFSAVIQLGMSLEFSFEHGGETFHVKTSPIREVWLDEIKILPSDRKAVQ